MPNLTRHVDPVNARGMTLKLRYTSKRGGRTLGMRKRTGCAGPKRATAVEVPLRRIFTAEVVRGKSVHEYGVLETGYFECM